MPGLRQALAYNIVYTAVYGAGILSENDWISELKTVA